MKKKVFIIAEAGVNHNGSINLAKKLIDAASDSGANAVKFQTFKTELNISKNAPKANYQKATTDCDESQYEMIKRLELDEYAHKELFSYCNEKNIIFLSTPFDHYSIDLLNDMGLKILKIPSGEITNLPYLRHIGMLNKKIILSNRDETIEGYDIHNIGRFNSIQDYSDFMPRLIEYLDSDYLLLIQDDGHIDLRRYRSFAALCYVSVEFRNGKGRLRAVLFLSPKPLKTLL